MVYAYVGRPSVLKSKPDCKAIVRALVDAESREGGIIT